VLRSSRAIRRFIVELKTNVLEISSVSIIRVDVERLIAQENFSARESSPIILAVGRRKILRNSWFVEFYEYGAQILHLFCFGTPTIQFVVRYFIAYSVCRF
jgi:hypothetical protein